LGMNVESEPIDRGKAGHREFEARRPFPSALPDMPVEEAFGSSRCGVALPRTTRPFSGDTLMRHDAFGVVPTSRPQRGIPFALRGPQGPFRRFYATMGRSDSSSSISPRFISIAWRYHRSSPSARDRAADQPGVGKPELRPAATMETASSPQFPGNPGNHSPCSPTPAGSGRSSGPRSSLPDAAPATEAVAMSVEFSHPRTDRGPVLQSLSDGSAPSLAHCPHR
jgi:hypothetical protein